jgi:hypothetical protein
MSQTSRDFSLREALEISQIEHAPLIIAQSVECLANESGAGAIGRIGAEADEQARAFQTLEIAPGL